MAANLHELAAGRIKRLGLSPSVAKALTEVQAELAAAHRDAVVEMAEAVRQQASALNRIQATLQVLIEHFRLDPILKAQVPPVVRIAADGESPDLASAVVVTAADPIGAGFTLSGSDLAAALDLNGSDISQLIAAFKLADDGDYAVVVRRGKRNKMVNYHPRAVERLRALIWGPIDNLSKECQAVLRRVRKKVSAPPQGE